MRTLVPRVAAVHDLSGFGRSSLTMVIPILSTMGVQVCPMPTAVLSTHTGGFENYKFIDLTDHLDEFIDHWISLKVEFDCIYTGFLGSARQIDIISRFIHEFNNEDQFVVIDPVMGDDGELYSSFDYEIVREMKKFIELGDIITPNITEAAYLLDEPFKNRIEEKEAKEWLVRLSRMGPKIVIITSVPDSKSDKVTYVMAYNKEDGRFWKVKCDYIPAHFAGTGDGFTSVIVGSLLQGDSLPIALDRATQLITSAIRASYGYKYPEREGVLLERVLSTLNLPAPGCTYEIVD